MLGTHSWRRLRRGTGESDKSGDQRSGRETVIQALGDAWGSSMALEPTLQAATGLSTGDGNNGRVRTSAPRDFATTLLANLVIGGLGVVTGLVAARLLGPDGRGRLALIQLWPGFLASFAILGQGEAIAYFSARYPAEARRYMVSSLLLIIGATIPALAIGYGLMPILLHAQPPVVTTEARWYLAFIPIYGLTLLLIKTLWGTQRFLEWNVLRTVPGIAWLGILLCDHFLSHSPNPATLAYVYVAALAILLIPTAMVALRHTARASTSGSDSVGARRRLTDLLNFGLPAMGTATPSLVNLRLDQIVIASILPARALGFYVVAVAWGSATSPVLTGLGSIVFPRVAASGTAARGQGVFTQGSRLAVLSGVLLCIPIVAVTPLAVPILFGDAYTKAIPSAMVLVPAGMVLGVNYVLAESLRGLGRPWNPLIAEAIGTPITAATLFILIAQLNILGAAISSLLGYLTVTVALLVFARRRLGVGFGDLVIPKMSDVTGVTRGSRDLLVSTVRRTRTRER